MNKLTVLSFGGGQDSTALLLKYINDKDFRSAYAPNDFIVIMADTGDEHQETYEHVEKMQALCKKEEIEFFFLTNDLGYHTENWKDLRSFYRRTRTVGSKAYIKSCSDNLKISPIYRFLEDYVANKYHYKAGRKNALKSFARDHGKIQMLIGISADEASRRIASGSRSKWQEIAIERIYPLVIMDWNRKECQEYINLFLETMPIPSNCILCPFMDKVELLWLYREQRSDFDEWVKLEADKIAHYADRVDADKNYGVWGKKTLDVIIKEAIDEFGYMTDAEIREYKMSHGHCVQTKY